MSKPSAALARLSAVENDEVYADLDRVNYDIPARKGVTVDRAGRYLVAKPADKVATELLEQIGVIPDVLGAQVLLAMYKRPERKDLGGGKFLHIPEQARDEDVYQGKVGLVLALGPLAYVDDKFRRFGGPWVRPGDWLLYPMYEQQTTRFDWKGKTVLATVVDDRARIVIPAPDVAR
jgi:hypothetical protein